MSILLTLLMLFDGNGEVRTVQRARFSAIAFLLKFHLGDLVSEFANDVRSNDDLHGAEPNAEVTFFAQLIVDFDLEGFLYAQGFLLPTNCSDRSIR